MGRRHACHDCREKYTNERNLQRASAVQHGRDSSTVARSDIDADAFTFMLWEDPCLKELHHGRSADFPFVLTRKAGLTKTLVSLMRPLYNFGIKPAQFASVVLEMHTLRHCQANLDYEHELTLKRGKIDFPLNAALEMFSSFSDSSKYNGCVPSGIYFGKVYKQYHDVRTALPLPIPTPTHPYPNPSLSHLIPTPTHPYPNPSLPQPIPSLSHPFPHLIPTPTHPYINPSQPQPIPTPTHPYINP